MPNIDILVLAILRGLTEFLPVSSSGHLILVPQFFCWPEQGLSLSIAAHAGVLVAVLVYFWRDVGVMLRGLYKFARGKRDPGIRLVALLLVATVPAMAVWLLLSVLAGDALRSAEITGWGLIIGGVVLYVADKIGLTVRRIEHLSVGQAFIIGAFQCLAFVPGTSRVGIAMTAARILGYERIAAARFAFLLAIPAIAASGLHEGFLLLELPQPLMLAQIGLMAACSAIAAFLAIAFIMYWLRRSGFWPFVLYRVILGTAVLYLIYRVPGGLEAICAI